MSKSKLIDPYHNVPRGIQALKRRIERIEKQLVKHSEQIAAMPEEIRQALDDFQRFFHDYHEYFQQDAVAPRPSRNKESAGVTGRPKQHTKERILAAALNNTLPLWETLNRAISQRFNSCFNEDFEAINAKAQILHEQFNGHIGTKAPIVYFEKRYHITRFLFRTNPLIGIPLDLVEDSNQGALAHELGHYFFWNNSPLSEHQQRIGNLRQAIINAVIKEKRGEFDPKVEDGNIQLPEQRMNAVFTSLRTWLHWVDELVADIIGTLLCGPSYVVNAQDLLASQIDSSNDLLIDDGEHPMPYLRPLIATTVLHLIAEKEGVVNKHFTDTISQLEKRWTEFRDSGGHHKPTIRGHHGQEDENASPVSPIELETYLEPIVRVILMSPLFLAKEEALQDFTSSIAERQEEYIALQEDKQQLMPLIDCITYWGKGIGEAKLLGEAQEALKKAEQLTPLLPRSTQATQMANAPAPTFNEIPQESPLHELLAYILQERERRKQQAKSMELDSEEWEDLLDLDLDLLSGHGSGESGWAWGEAYVYHKHINGRAVCC